MDFSTNFEMCKIECESWNAGFKSGYWYIWYLRKLVQEDASIRINIYIETTVQTSERRYIIC